MRIVLADQRTSMLKYFQNYLADIGYDTAVAKDGLECLSVLRRATPDVLVLSAALHWGGAEGVLDVMLEDPVLRDVPTLLLLDYQSESQLHRHPMVVSILRRPFQPHELERNIVFLHLVNQKSMIANDRYLLPVPISHGGKSGFVVGRV